MSSDDEMALGEKAPFQRNCKASISMENFLQLMLKVVEVQLEAAVMSRSIMEHAEQLKLTSVVYAWRCM